MPPEGWMEAARAHRHGPPESLTLERLPLAEPGPGQVRIATQAAGVSFVDVLITAGRYQVQPPLPYTPGTELAGVVDAVGEGVTGLAPGDRVCASGFIGGFATHAIAPATAVTRMLDDMDFTAASVFRASYCTAYHALVQRARLAAGETVMVLGAGGAVGVAAIEVARALGAHVVACASSPEKRALAQDCGAEVVIDSRAEDFCEQVAQATGGRGPDVVVDPVGGAATELAFCTLAWNGRHLVVGFAAGEIPRLKTNLPLLKGAALIGLDIRRFGEREPDVAQANLAALFELYGTGALKPRVAVELPLTRFAKAMQLAAAGETAGRIVLRTA